jgi:hypothetical protein
VREGCPGRVHAPAGRASDLRHVRNFKRDRSRTMASELYDLSMPVFIRHLNGLAACVNEDR